MLILFGIVWKSAILLLSFIVILIIILIGGYSRTKLLGKEILRKKLIGLGASEEILDPIFDSNLLPPRKDQKQKPFIRKEEDKKNIKIKFNINSIEYFKESQKYFKLGDFDNAIKKLKLSIDHDPQNWYSHLLLGSIFLNFKNDADNALKYLKNAMELDKNHFNQYMNAGVAYIWKGENELAINALNESIDIIERDKVSRHLPRIIMEYGKCLMFIAEAYLNLQNSQKSIEYLKNATSKFNEVPPQYRDEGINYWLDEAEKRLKEYKKQA